RELLEALEQLQRGAPSRMSQHPRSPESINKLLTYDFEWHLASSPEALWPHVSNTERLNRAIGLDAIEFRRRVRGGQVETYGRIRLSGLLLEWREHRYEWVTPHRMGVLREFSQGPFVWLKSSVELLPVGSGTLLRHQVQVEPRGVLGRAAASLEVGIKAKKNLERVYERIDRFVSKAFAPEGTALLANEDPFEDSPKLTERELERLRIGEERLLDLHLDDEVVTRLCDFLRWAPAQEVARIRPRVFARHFALDHREVLRICLHAARLGVLTMLWDVICPRCQIPSSIQESLRALRAHARCEACDVDFELDFGNSVEIVFRVHPEVRQSDIGTYCIGGPAHTPHVIAQLRLAPGERFAMDLRLDEGHYQVTGPELALAWGFSVRKGASLAQWELNLTSGLPPAAPRAVSSGRQRIVLVNDFDREVVARVERASSREDAVTASEVACTSLFRELFPMEALAPGQLVSVSKVTLLLVELAEAWSDGASEARTFARLMELARRATDIAEQEGGAVVKLIGDGVLLSFNDAVAAVRAALALIDSDLRVGGHTGTAMATSINERLDYFGRLVRDLDALTGAATPGQVLLSEHLCSDAGVAALLAPREPSLVFAAGVVAQAFTAS
ncbi:MAG TPA: DUF5939 domain-containing protein, partial [Polyangiaceae bacterium]|nr:DUF5939 domain-containing protein [Polyangiaceae bacterium]